MMNESEDGNTNNEEAASSGGVCHQPKKPDLADFLATNPVPCFASVSTSAKSSSSSSPPPPPPDIVYLYKEFTSECLLAKSYSNLLVNYLLHQRPSYVPSEIDFGGSEKPPSTSNLMTNRLAFTDIVSIPLHYPGLFEVFSSNSVKTGGILDHETDLISFASRLRKSKLYYVAKEIKVYELIHHSRRNSSSSGEAPNDSNTMTSTVISKKNLSRKWVRIPSGSVCRTIRLVSLDDHSTGIINGGGKSPAAAHSMMHTSWLLHTLKEIICCKFEHVRAKKNSDLAIELKLVSDMGQLYMSGASSSSDSISPAATLNGRNEDKTYFLPVYESGLDNEIDLIPVSSDIKNNRLKTNNLHLAKNFVLNDQLLLDNYIELKLFDENPFDKSLALKGHVKKSPKSSGHKCASSSSSTHSLVNDNQHLEAEKYISIFDLVEYRPQCKLVVGFNLTTSSIFIMPSRPLAANEQLAAHSPAVVFSRLTESERYHGHWSAVIDKFLAASSMNAFARAAQHEIDVFERSLNRIEMFEGHKHANGTSREKSDELVQGGGGEKMQASSIGCAIRTIPTVTHFSDLVNIDSGNGSDEMTSDEFKSVNGSNNSSNGDIEEEKYDVDGNLDVDENLNRKRMKDVFRSMPVNNTCKIEESSTNSILTAAINKGHPPVYSTSNSMPNETMF